jgi:hypothetical protein
MPNDATGIAGEEVTALVEVKTQIAAGQTERAKAILRAHYSRQKGNDRLALAGEHFGFATVLVGDLRWMLTRELATLTYGYGDTSVLQRLLTRYDLEPQGIKAFDHNGRKLLRQASQRPLTSTTVVLTRV